MIPATATGNEELTGLAGWVVDIVASMGSVGVGALVTLENLFPPIPSEVVLPLAGFQAGRGELGLVAVLAWALAGSLVGALLLYGVGAAVGRERVERLVDKVPLMETEDVERASNWFDRHGEMAVLIGRLIPGVRSLISIPAGLERMPLVRFVALTLLGSAAWNSLLVFAGYLLGSQWRSIGRYSDYINWAIIACLAIAVGVFVVKRLQQRAGRPG